MTKAEEQALKAYPKMSRITEPEGTLIGDGNAEKRVGFVKGYNQAEKDFIEKACDYLNKTCRKFILTEKDIEDFNNYMKGE